MMIKRADLDIVKIFLQKHILTLVRLIRKWKMLDTRHWEIQLQGWNANCDTKLASVEHACIEYFEKCTSKGKKYQE